MGRPKRIVDQAWYNWSCAFLNGAFAALFLSQEAWLWVGLCGVCSILSACIGTSRMMEDYKNEQRRKSSNNPNQDRR